MTTVLKVRAFAPTVEQQAIIDAARERSESLMITAYAGCAKTTTLELIGEVLPRTAPALALAFNVKIKKALEKVFPSTIDTKTLNGLGHTAWQRAIGRRLEVEPKKQTKLLTEYLKETDTKLSMDQWESVATLIRTAMSQGLVPRPYDQTFPGLLEDDTRVWQDLAFETMSLHSEHLEEIARAVLLRSIKQSYEGLISFDDQIYMSTLFKGAFPKFPTVLVDEAQDLSPLNHLQLQRCCSDRLIVVGDPKQAIYGFRGADEDSMAKIKRLRPAWIELPLSMTFRVPRVMVQRQQDHAPGFKAAPSNLEGSFADWNFSVWREALESEARYQETRKKEMLSSNDPGTAISIPPGDGWEWSRFGSLQSSPRATMAVLCRNNAPLLGLAFKLIRQGVPAVMLGRDIGKNLVTLSKKILPDDSTSSADCAKLIEAWKEHECALARANEHEEKVAAITDRAECLQAVLSYAQARSAGELRSSLAALFGREVGKVTLSTIHRAKGLEWDMVLHLDPFRIPSKFARQQAALGHTKQLKQELNLRYVAETRTKDVFVQARLEDLL